MARTPQGNRKTGSVPGTASQRAPISSSDPGANLTLTPDVTKRNSDGTFRVGISGNPAGNQTVSKLVGATPKRLDVRHHLRRCLEIPEDEWTKVPMSAGERLARKAITELETLAGEVFIRSLKTTAETAHGSLVVQENADHLSGQAARDRVDALLAQADELRRRSREAKGA